MTEPACSYDRSASRPAAASGASVVCSSCQSTTSLEIHVCGAHRLRTSGSNGRACCKAFWEILSWRSNLSRKWFVVEVHRFHCGLVPSYRWLCSWLEMWLKEMPSTTKLYLVSDSLVYVSIDTAARVPFLIGFGLFWIIIKRPLTLLLTLLIIRLLIFLLVISSIFLTDLQTVLIL